MNTLKNHQKQWPFVFLFLLILSPTTFSFVQLSSRKILFPLHGFFDSFQKKLSDAFANDAEFQVKENVGRKLSVEHEKQMSNARRIEDSDIIGSCWEIEISVKGIASNDESNDLYAAKSVAGKQDGVPFTICFTVVEDGLLEIKENSFTAVNVKGKWQLDENDRFTIAFALPCVGFERSIKTIGSITSVMGGEDTDRTTSSYFVPQGTCLIQANIRQNNSGRFSFH